MWIEYFSFGYTSYNMLPKQRWIFDNSIVLKYFWVKKKGKNSSAVTFLGILIPKLSWAATNETRAFGAYFHRKYSEFIYFRAIMLKKGFQFKWTLYGVCVFFWWSETTRENSFTNNFIGLPVNSAQQEVHESHNGAGATYYKR